MSYVSIREFTPYDGKDAVLEPRLRRAISAMTKHGAASSLYKVIGGDRAGDYEVYNWYETVGAGSREMKGFSADPEMLAVQAERAADPIAQMRGPWLGRMLYNQQLGGERNISVHRDYAVERKDVPKMMEFVPDLQKICDGLDAELGVGVPLIAEDHQMMRVVYRLKDLEHWGDCMDALIANTDFASLLEKANEIGTLTQSRLIMKIG